MISKDNSPRKSSGCEVLGSKLLRVLANRRSRALLRRWRLGLSATGCSSSWIMLSRQPEEELRSFSFLHFCAISPLLSNARITRFHKILYTQSSSLFFSLISEKGVHFSSIIRHYFHVFLIYRKIIQTLSKKK